MILCLGTTPTVQRSMTFDGLKLDDVNRAIDVKDYASGKSPNVARVLRTMGHEPLAVGFAGGDRGKFLLADLAMADICCDFVAIPQQTRLCTTIIDRLTRMATELVEEHSPVALEAWDALDCKLRARLPASKTWIFSGSLPAGAPQDFYARWVPLARQSGATLILDARGEPLKLALNFGGFIAKLNREELAATLKVDFPTDADLIDATRRIAPANGAAIITMGSKGAVASDGTRAWWLTSPRVKAISAVGSGDAFAAGLAMGLARGEALPQAMKLAAACGAANAMTALAGHVNPADVEMLRSQAIVTEVD